MLYKVTSTSKAKKYIEGIYFSSLVSGVSVSGSFLLLDVGLASFFAFGFFRHEGAEHVLDVVAHLLHSGSGAQVNN